MRRESNSRESESLHPHPPSFWLGFSLAVIIYPSIIIIIIAIFPQLILIWVLIIPLGRVQRMQDTDVFDRIGAGVFLILPAA
jgi:hypothetical protein